MQAKIAIIIGILLPFCIANCFVKIFIFFFHCWKNQPGKGIVLYIKLNWFWNTTIWLNFYKWKSSTNGCRKIGFFWKIIFSKLPIRQNTGEAPDLVQTGFSKLPIRQNTKKLLRPFDPEFSKLPIRQNTRTLSKLKMLLIKFYCQFMSKYHFYQLIYKLWFEAYFKTY